jgi:NAD(P)-dependent dehydrogenase (short-subunit alcohol dehydrogenase family)
MAMTDPRTQGPQPPYPPQTQEPPGVEGEMRPAADHGEDSYRGCDRLRDRAALVTGADSGIGRAVALAFAREGADVLVSYLSEHEDAKETVRLVEEAGRRAVAIAGDIGDKAHCEALVERAVNEFGRLDVLVNNAAFQQVHDSIEDHPSDEIERIFRTNVLAMFWLSQAAVPHMKPGAAIVNTTSIQAYDPSPELLPYSTTKGAIVTFTKGLAQELTPKGIRVNAVAPGPVWTPLIPMSMPEEATEQFGSDTPLGRTAQPGEIAPCYVFLACDEARFVSGEILAATGGKPTA